MIAIERLVYGYEGSAPVLDGVSLSIGEGEYIALIGRTGCGKTTLVKHLNGLILPASGRVSVDGMDTRDRRHLAEIRRRVGMIFQNPDNQVVGVTVEEDVAFGPGNLGLPPPEIRRRVDETLAGVGLTAHHARHPHTLSGGEKQLLALAGVLAMEPRYIILDEPTSSLDPSSRDRVLSMVRSLNDRGIAVIHVTHNMEDVTCADRVVVMDKGNIMAEGTPADLFCRVEWLKSLGLAAPRVTELLWRLHRIRGEVNPSVLTLDAALQEIEALVGRPAPVGGSKDR